MGERVYGAKYDAKLGTKEIAVKVREDIKSAVKSGMLPKGKYSVRIERYSGGSSINVGFVFEDETIPVLNPPRVKFEVEHPYDFPGNNGEETSWLYSTTTRATMRDLEDILEAYNHDGSDPMTDYCDVKFHTHIRPEMHDREIAQRDKARAEHEAKKAQKCAAAALVTGPWDEVFPGVTPANEDAEIDAANIRAERASFEAEQESEWNAQQDFIGRLEG